MEENEYPPPHNNRGFTLIEMLLVVAIIAVLVAVSIPALNGSLEKARESTDMANERAARTAVTLAYCNNDPILEAAFLVYDAATGDLVAVDIFDSSSLPKGYGKCADHQMTVLWLDLDIGGDYVTMYWTFGREGITTPTGYCHLVDGFPLP